MQIIYVYSTDSILRTIEEAGFTIAMSKEMYLSREQAQEFYEEHKDQDYFDSLVNNMTRYALPCFVRFFEIQMFLVCKSD